MTDVIAGSTVGVTAGETFDLTIEREVFDGTDVELRPVEVSSTRDLMSAFADVDAVIDRLLAAPYTSAVIDAFESCAVIARCGIGVDQIDLERASECGIAVVNVPRYCQDEVSEHALLLVLALQRNLIDYDSALKRGEWRQGLQETPIHRLRGQTIGLVGYGTIARLVAEKAKAFGMDVVASDPYVAAGEMEADDVAKASFEDVIASADVVSAHAPLVAETEGMFDAEAFARMRDSAVLVNVARGGLVVEDDLVTALDRGEIAGAALDVFDHEPSGTDGDVPAFKNPLRKRDDVVLTPHVAWYSEESDAERRRTAARHVRRVLSGERPKNLVNDPR